MAGGGLVPRTLQISKAGGEGFGFLIGREVARFVQRADPMNVSYLLADPYEQFHIQKRATTLATQILLSSR